jgi:hypothetical protein
LLQAFSNIELGTKRLRFFVEMHVLGLAAYVGLVHLDGTTITHLHQAVVLERHFEAMQHEPCTLLSDATHRVTL